MGIRTKLLVGAVAAIALAAAVAATAAPTTPGIASLSGRGVAVQVGTTEMAALMTENRLLAKQHRKPVVIKLFQKDSDAAAALVTGKVDAYFSDDPPIGYYVKTTGGKFEVAASKIQAAPYGIATRKHDPVGPAMRLSVATLYRNGTMKA